METYPIFINGAEVGTLTVTADGRRTVFEADCEMREGIVRLSVYGGGREGRLGVLAPESGRLRLRRTLSPLQMQGFPQRIEYAAPAGERPPQAKAEPQEADAEAPAVPQQTTEAMDAPEAETAERRWYSSPEGGLGTADGENGLAAFPVDGSVALPAFRGERRTIEGKEYEVYITQNGFAVKPDSPSAGELSS
ncbi:MAG: hypothetical protein LUC19_07785 [Oscillospiraceae bacterium]|nr:hypothetical protein [Oscillospiraceae bacterium]